MIIRYYDYKVFNQCLQIISLLKGWKLSIILLTSLFLGACELSPVRSVVVQPSIDDLSSRAVALFERGLWLDAAVSYEELVTLDRTNSVIYQFRAAEAYFMAKDLKNAQRLLGDIQQEEIAPLLRLKKILMEAYIAQSAGQIEKALQILQPTLSGRFPKENLIEYYLLKAELLTQQHRYLAALDSYLLMFKYVEDAADYLDELWSIWGVLNNVSLTKLERQNQRSSMHTPWVELAILYRTILYDSEDFKAKIDSWKDRFPGHFASEVIVPILLKESQTLDIRPEHIALLLPLDEIYRELTMAIREGFFLAWYADQRIRPKISFYDTTAMDIVMVYQKAVAAGADFVVGPLQKANIKTLLDREVLTVPTLLLNTLPGTTHFKEQPSDSPHYLFFALSPEEEAKAIAEQAWLAGHSVALTMVPETEWGVRMNKAFQRRWQEFGGKIVATGQFQDEQNSYSQVVKQLLSIDDSQRRALRLRIGLGTNLKFQARRRADIDFIFLAAPAQTARQIVPQFVRQGAGDVPIYGSSHIYSGHPDEVNDKDLEGVYFVDIPWVIEPTLKHSVLQRKLNDAWAQSISPHRRLYAFGIDAYEIITIWPRLLVNPTARFSGMTGVFRIEDGHYIHRKLVFARFIDGLPVWQRQ